MYLLFEEEQRLANISPIPDKKPVQDQDRRKGGQEEKLFKNTLAPGVEERLDEFFASARFSIDNADDDEGKAQADE